MIILITGGTRSGKSNYAQQLALQLSDKPVYVATAREWDEDFKERIERHKAGRDERWTNMEEERWVSKLPIENSTVVIDCITLWLTNFFSEYHYEIDPALESIKKEIDALCGMKGTYIIVSNELGMGLHAETAIGRKFTDLQGWANQYIAAKSGKVLLMVAGIPVTIKQTSNAVNHES
jgi:adenosylcobinamide kinase/adenosylcobinamide-phosphate guanylyltransferase